MNIEDLFYRVGEPVEAIGKKIKDIINPMPQENPPSFKFLNRLIKKKLQFMS